jgi:hypothetical protein
MMSLDRIGLSGLFLCGPKSVVDYICANFTPGSPIYLVSIEVGKGCGMEINVEKTKTTRISRQPTPLQIKIDRKPMENVEEFNYLGNMITNDVRCTREIKARIAMSKAAFNKKKTLRQQIRPRAKEEISDVLHLEHSCVWYGNLDSS